MARQQKTGSELAQVLNCSQSSASRRMTGEISLDLDEIAVISDWLNIPPFAFVTVSSNNQEAA